MTHLCSAPNAFGAPVGMNHHLGSVVLRREPIRTEIDA
jgi:hypothetical protein